MFDQSTVSTESRALSYKLQCNVFKLRLLVWFFAGTGKTLLEQEKNAKDIDFIVLRSISRRIW